MFFVFLMVDTTLTLMMGCFWRRADVLTESSCNPVRERGREAHKQSEHHRGQDEDDHDHHGEGEVDHHQHGEENGCDEHEEKDDERDEDNYDASIQSMLCSD